MTAFIPDTTNAKVMARVAHFQSRLHLVAPDNIRFSLLDHELLVEGSVSSYELKCKIDRVVNTYGLQVQNCLRVIPGAAITSPRIIAQP